MNKTQFDWRAFLDEHGIDYVEAGHGEWLSIDCPLCGDDDGKKMNLHADPSSPGYHCWRDHEHRGRDPILLIMKILGCNRQEAFAQLAIFPGPIQDVLPVPTPKIEKPQTLMWPDSIKPLAAVTDYTQKFFDYLHKERGFDDPQAMAMHYDLRYSLVDDQKDRVVIPVWTPDEGLVTWTGRSIHRSEKLRYKTLSTKRSTDRPDEIIALRSAKEVIYYSPPTGYIPDTLVVVEGPFDALKVDWYGKQYGIRATCLFGIVWSEVQVARTIELANHFRHVAVCFDAAKWHDSISFSSMLAAHHEDAYSVPLPRSIEDPGELTPELIKELFAHGSPK